MILSDTPTLMKADEATNVGALFFDLDRYLDATPFYSGCYEGPDLVLDDI